MLNIHNKDILFKKSIADIKAITLDLDDTLWPVAPTIAGAEQDLFDWLSTHVPKTADLTRQSDVKKTIRQEVTAKHHARAHDLGFLRREMIRESLRLAGDDPFLADTAYAVFDTARQRVTLFHGVEQALARLALKYRLVAISNGTANVFVTPASPYFDAAFSAHEVGVAGHPHQLDAGAPRQGVFAIAPDNLDRALARGLVREAVAGAVEPDHGVDAVGRLGEVEDHLAAVLALETRAGFGGGGLCLCEGGGAGRAQGQKRDERAMDG